MENLILYTLQVYLMYTDRMQKIDFQFSLLFAWLLLTKSQYNRELLMEMVQNCLPINDKIAVILY